MVSDFYEQLFGDLISVCQPLGVEVVRQTIGVPSRVTVEVRPAEEGTYEVTLYSGALSVENDEVGEEADQRLCELLKHTPYRTVETIRGQAFGNMYRVGPA